MGKSGTVFVKGWHETYTFPLNILSFVMFLMILHHLVILDIWSFQKEH